MKISFKKLIFKAFMTLLIIEVVFSIFGIRIHISGEIFKILIALFILSTILKPEKLIPYFMNLRNKHFLSIQENTNEYKRIWAFNPQEYLTVYLNYVIEGKKTAVYLFESDKVLGYNIKLSVNNTMYNNLVSELNSKPIAEIVKSYNAEVFFDGKPIQNYSQEFNRINHY